jgi:lipoprotein signal peptidase
MATSSTRRPLAAWLAAFLLAAPVAPALAQTRVVVSVEGFSAPVAPAAGVSAAGMGSASMASPASFAASPLYSAPSAPTASITRGIEPGVAASAVAAAPAFAAPALAAASVHARTAPVSAAATVSGGETAFAPAAHPAASIGSPFVSHEAASLPISHIRAESAREAAAIATVEGGIANWTARESQSLDATPVLAAASNGSAPLDRASAASSAERPAAETPAPAPSKLKAMFTWAWPILALTALVTSIDFGTKMFAVHHLFHVFHECAWRTPFLMGIIPYIAFTAFKARSGLANDHKVWQWSPKKIKNGRFGFYQLELSGMNAMIKDHPSLRWANRLYDVSIALMVGGMLGNGIDALRLGGALDWIPLGRSLMNFADVALLTGLAFFQLGTGFFVKAAMAHKSGKPLYFNSNWFLGLPLAGVFIAWAFGSSEGAGALDLAMKNIGFLYLMGFSMLVGSSRFLASIVMNRFVSRFVAEEGERLAAVQAPAQKA